MKENRIEIINHGNDSAESCPAVCAYTQYASNHPEKREDSFELDIEKHAPKVVGRIHSVLKKIGKGSC